MFGVILLTQRKILIFAGGLVTIVLSNNVRWSVRQWHRNPSGWGFPTRSTNASRVTDGGIFPRGTVSTRQKPPSTSSARDCNVLAIKRTIL